MGGRGRKQWRKKKEKKLLSDDEVRQRFANFKMNEKSSLTSSINSTNRGVAETVLKQEPADMKNLMNQLGLDISESMRLRIEKTRKQDPLFQKGKLIDSLDLNTGFEALVKEEVEKISDAPRPEIEMHSPKVT